VHYPNYWRLSTGGSDARVLLSTWLRASGYPLLMTPKVKRRRGVTRVSSKHQITIPVDAMKEAHVLPGDELRVKADGRGRLILTVVDDPLEALIGSAPGLSAETDLQALRDEWER
jgi:bifunctional DNA-binding transcriptional regulator/antitoxin component of YhaV-PrlF toxin-antitoxin module